MSEADNIKKRFDEIMARLKAVRSRLDLPVEDSTVVVDVGDLERKCQRYEGFIDRLLQLPAVPEIDDPLGKLLIDIHVAVQDLEMCCSGLKGPLDRLISAVYDRLPEDPEYADDAS